VSLSVLKVAKIQKYKFVRLGLVCRKGLIALKSDQAVGMCM